MTDRKTLLLMSRGMRVHRFFLQMARALVGAGHRVVMLAQPEELQAFGEVPGLEVQAYESPDMLFGRNRRLWRPAPGDMRAAAAEVERELGLPVYKSAGNYLLFGRIVREYGGHWDYLTTEEEILQAYVGSYRQLRRVFDEVRPDALFYECIDLISANVAFGMALQRGIFAWEPRFSPLGKGKISLGFGMLRRNMVLEHLYANRSLIPEARRQEADRVLAGLADAFAQSSYIAAHRTILARGRAGRQPRSARELAAYAKKVVRTLPEIRRYYRLTKNRRWANQHLSKAAPEGPYILFPLQHVPEAGLCSQSPRWVRQDSVIEQLAINAPNRLRVVAREHPRTIGRRGPEFFRPLTDLPNVTACHPAVDMRALMAGAEAVVTVTGTPGFEAALFGKRVGVLGRPFYSIYKGVRRLNHPDEIYTAMSDPAWRPEAMHDERREFLAAYLESLHEFGHGEDGAFYPQEGGDRWAQTLLTVMEFARRHQLTPAQFESGLAPC